MPNEHVKQANQIASDHIKTFPTQMAHVPGMVAPQTVSMVTMPQVLPTQGIPAVPKASISQIITSSSPGIPVTNISQVTATSQGVPLSTLSQVVTTAQGVQVATMPQVVAVSQGTPAAVASPKLPTAHAVPVAQVSQSENLAMPPTISMSQRLPAVIGDATNVSHSLPTVAPSQESQPMQPNMQNLVQQIPLSVAESRTEIAGKPVLVHSSIHACEFSQTSQLPTVQPVVPQQPSINQINIPDAVSSKSGKRPDSVVANHSEVKELSSPSTATQVPQEAIAEANSKSDASAEETENVPSGTSTVAIDNKIEQAMDLVKSHLMFAVREEVDVLKEKITELMDRISQLEYENSYLRANATQQTLEQLNQTQLLQQQQLQQLQQLQQQHQQQQQHQHQNLPPSGVSMNSVPQQPPQQEHLNIQNQHQPS